MLHLRHKMPLTSSTRSTSPPPLPILPQHDHRFLSFIQRSELSERGVNQPAVVLLEALPIAERAPCLQFEVGAMIRFEIGS